MHRVCQAWGGPRALKSKWSNEVGSTAANDHDKSRTKGFGGRTAGDAGMTSVLARLMLAQMAQKSSTRRGEFVRCEGEVRLAAWSAFAATAQASG